MTLDLLQCTQRSGELDHPKNNVLSSIWALRFVFDADRHSESDSIRCSSTHPPNSRHANILFWHALCRAWISDVDPAEDPLRSDALVGNEGTALGFELVLAIDR